jgi:hypothetical protein
MANPQPELARACQWHPWPPGDPAPEIWRIIQDLDRKVQLRVVDAVLHTQIAITRAHVEGLESIRKIVSGAQPG